MTQTTKSDNGAALALTLAAADLAQIEFELMDNADANQDGSEPNMEMRLASRIRNISEQIDRVVKSLKVAK